MVGLHERIPGGLTADQHSRMQAGLSKTACMMAHWFADRAFTCPDSLDGTIETYMGLVLANAHNAE